MTPSDAFDNMEFTTEYMFARREQLMKDEDIDDLVSMTSEDCDDDQVDRQLEERPTMNFGGARPSPSARPISFRSEGSI